MHGLEAGERWIRTFGTAEDAGVLAGLVISIAPTFPSREIRKKCHEAAFEISVASRGTDGSNLVPSSGESDELSLRAAVPDRWAPTERLRTAALLSVPHSPVEVISPFFVAPRERKQIELRIGEMAFILGDGQQLGR